MPRIEDLIDPQELTGFVRQVFENLDVSNNLLSRWFPVRNTLDTRVEVRVGAGSTAPRMARARAWDAVAQPGRREKRSRKRFALIPVSERLDVGEEDEIRQRTGAAVAATLELNVRNDAQVIAERIAARIEFFRGQALDLGAISETFGEASEEVDFQRKADRSEVAPLGADWDDPAADILGDLENFLSIVPGLRVVLAGRRVRMGMYRNTQLLKAVYAGGGIQADSTTRDQINRVLAERDLPIIVPYDGEVIVEDGTFDGTVEKIIRPTSVVLTANPDTTPLGATFMGPTVEAYDVGKLVNEEAPGIFCWSYRRDGEKQSHTEGNASVLPALVNPDLTLQATVLDNA